VRGSTITRFRSPEVAARPAVTPSDHRQTSRLNAYLAPLSLPRERPQGGASARLHAAPAPSPHLPPGFGAGSPSVCAPGTSRPSAYLAPLTETAENASAFRS